MKTYFLISLFALTLPIDLIAQWDQNPDQRDILIKMGIVRIEIRQTILASSSRETDRILNSETLFDSLGRTVKISNDGCRACGTTYTYDSLTGLNTFTRYVWSQGYRDTYTEYDEQKRRITSEICTNGEDDCAYYTFEYDEENTERMYRINYKKQIKRDTAKRSVHFLGLYSVREEKKELVHEKFFTPEGQLEETRQFQDGKFRSSALNEYNTAGQWIRVWHFDGKIKQVSNEVERNERGQIISRKTYSLSSGDPLHTLVPPNIQTYEYDENGLLVKMTTPRTITEYVYFTE